jgi:hypothetical protein
VADYAVVEVGPALDEGLKVHGFLQQREVPRRERCPDGPRRVEAPRGQGGVLPARGALLCCHPEAAFD